VLCHRDVVSSSGTDRSHASRRRRARTDQTREGTRKCPLDTSWRDRHSRLWQGAVRGRQRGWPALKLTKPM
jgi:hypothetical protein